MMTCRCREKTGEADRSYISMCALCTQITGYVLPPEWLAKIPLPPMRTRETNAVWAHKMSRHRRAVLDTIRAFDQQRKKEVA